MDVTDIESRPRLGQIVKVLRGRDAGSLAIVVGLKEPHMVLLADGDRRKIDRPKKKNMKHIQITNAVSEEVAEALKTFGRVNDEKLRYALNQYLLKQEQKGE